MSECSICEAQEPRCNVLFFTTGAVAPSKCGKPHLHEGDHTPRTEPETVRRNTKPKEHDWALMVFFLSFGALTVFSIVKVITSHHLWWMPATFGGMIAFILGMVLLDTFLQGNIGRELHGHSDPSPQVPIGGGLPLRW